MLTSVNIMRETVHHCCNRIRTPVIEQEIRALFLAHGFKIELKPDGSTDFDPAYYSVAQALTERFNDIWATCREVEIVAAGGAEARTMPLFHDKGASIEFPTYIMRQPSKISASTNNKA